MKTKMKAVRVRNLQGSELEKHDDELAEIVEQNGNLTLVRFDDGEEAYLSPHEYSANR